MSANSPLSCDQVRQFDQAAVTRYGIPGLVLMENAGRSCAELLCAIDGTGPVVICCGRGNNGGDGLVIARHLDQRGIAVRILFWSDPDELSGDARVNWEIAKRAGLESHTLAPPHHSQQLAELLDGAVWIVDGLLGTGTRGAPRPPLDQVITQLNNQSARRLAIDIPSGLNGDTGEAAAATFRADHTCTFVAAKPGLLRPANAQFVGRLHVVHLGTPGKILAEFGIRYSDALMGGS